MKAVITGLIRFYQIILSPLIGRCCRFDPSCSEYMIQCVQQYGCATGLLRGLKRLSRCHPFHAGGYDPAV